MVQLRHLSALDGYDEIMVTGGEPTAVPEHTARVVYILRKRNPTAKIYLYSARYTDLIKSLLPLLDGVHYTVHSMAVGSLDLSRFERMQSLARQHCHEKSFRLYIHPSVDCSVPIVPTSWTRVEVKPWIGPDEIRLPDDEELFILVGQTFGK
jgi:hypothetical protein